MNMSSMSLAVTQPLPPISSVSLLEEMYVDLRPRFLSLAYSMVRNREDAEDAVQDAFVSAHRNFPHFEGRSALATWFTRIVVNASLMQLRKRKSSRLVATPDAGVEEDTPWIERIHTSRPDPEELCAEAETMQLVDTLLHTASPSVRAAFKLKHYDDVSAEEGARHLGITANTFKSRVFRAGKHLRARGKYSLIAPIRKSNHSATRMSDPRSWTLSRAAA
jgi:RNA polymerase sigma-70 factor, ECF subfamily